MHEPVLMNAHVNERTERRHVGDHALENHPGL